jgi:AcrR family transcriptional regulator
VATAKKRSRSWAKVAEPSKRWKAQREALLQAAQRAIHRLGPHASMEDIAAEAGITKPIIYRHFGDRRGLAVALRNQAFEFILGSGGQSSAEARRAARERVAALYPVVDDAAALQRVLLSFGTGFLMFVEYNRNLYRFLRGEGVLDRMWDHGGEAGDEPVSASVARSLQAIYGARGVDDATALTWARGLRGMITGIVDWSVESAGYDRFALERQLDALTRAVLAGLDRTLPVSARPRGSTSRASGTSRSRSSRRR